MIFTAVAVFAGVMCAGLLAWRFWPRSPQSASAAASPAPSTNGAGLATGNPEFAIAPFIYLMGDPPGPQQVVLEAPQSFRLVHLDFLTGSGKTVARQELNLEGRHITHPIADSFIRSVLRLESNPWDGSGIIQLRFHLESGSSRRDVLFVAFVIPEMKLGEGGRMTESRRLVDPRTLPASMESSLVD